MHGNEQLNGCPGSRAPICCPSSLGGSSADESSCLWQLPATGTTRRSQGHTLASPQAGDGPAAARDEPPAAGWSDTKDVCARCLQCTPRSKGRCHCSKPGRADIRLGALLPGQGPAGPAAALRPGTARRMI